MSKDRNRDVEPNEDDATLGAHRLPNARAIARLLGVEQSDLLSARLEELSKLVWIPETSSESWMKGQITRLLELYESLEPADGAEGMLAMQMVGTHYAAIESLRRAALPDQTFEGRDMALKQAHKLMALYTQQVATLNKNRGKGQQKVTVEHVHVEAGGQAIVGNVGTPVTTSAPSPTPAAIENLREISMEPISEEEIRSWRRTNRR